MHMNGFTGLTWQTAGVHGEVIDARRAANAPVSQDEAGSHRSAESEK